MTIAALTRPVALCILDGWGLRETREANAVALGHTPVFDELMRSCPNATLTTHGPAVGLPEGQMGNSEVGHMNIGAGRTVRMDLPRIDNAIAEGSLATRSALAAFIAALKASGGTAHVAGLLSPGGVHSHQRHIAELARILTRAGIEVALHLFLDGRDTPPKSALEQLDALHADLGANPKGAPGLRIATICGRYYAMDRDNRWQRVKRAHDVILHAEGAHAPNARAAVEAAYARGESDEFVSPAVIGDYAGARDGDGLLMANFRSDRAREILAALADPDFAEFDAGDRPQFAAVAGMVEYSTRHTRYMSAIFPQEAIVNTLGQWLSAHGKAQYRLAETEKYPHVTFFFNGGIEEPHPAETRYVAPSPKVATYDLEPEMSSGEVTEKLVAAIGSNAYDLIIVNYANPDMVGHTGDLNAAIAAVESVDRGLGAAVAALRTAGGAMIVTADHGNCETMVDPETGGAHTAHTTNPVPVILVNGPQGATLRADGALRDLAPTLLALMDLPQPPQMTGISLLRRARA